MKVGLCTDPGPWTLDPTNPTIKSELTCTSTTVEALNDSRINLMLFLKLLTCTKDNIYLEKKQT